MDTRLVNAAMSRDPLAGQVISSEQAKASSTPAPTVRVSVEVRATYNFADALMGVMDGKRITRSGWNAGGQYAAMQIPDKGSMMSKPYLYLKNAQNEMVPWVPSQGDLLRTTGQFCRADPMLKRTPMARTGFKRSEKAVGSSFVE